MSPPHGCYQVKLWLSLLCENYHQGTPKIWINCLLSLVSLLIKSPVVGKNTQASSYYFNINFSFKQYHSNLIWSKSSLNLSIFSINHPTLCVCTQTQCYTSEQQCIQACITYLQQVGEDGFPVRDEGSSAASTLSKGGDDFPKSKQRFVDAYSFLRIMK